MIPVKKREISKGMNRSKRETRLSDRGSLPTSERVEVAKKSKTTTIARKIVEIHSTYRPKFSRLPQEDISFIKLSEYLDTFAIGSGNLDNAAEKMLAKGIAAVISIEELDEGQMLKIYPDNKKEIITLDSNYQEIVLRTL